MSSVTVLNGRYELHRRLARGGMADVFLARDQLLDRPVAVKVLFAEFSTDPAFVERFRREAQAAANLTHANIVSVYDWGEQAGTYYIVMEYVEGRSLAEILRTEGPLHPQRAAEIAADIAAALGFAHRNGVVHRDVKPGNVLISPSGQVKVADFGIARAMGAGVEQNLTQTGAVMGTATYFSPEQAQGMRLDPRSDLYALGVVLYEMVTGRPPFTGDSPVAIAYKHVQEQPPSPRSLGADVPPALEAIIMRLLAKAPGNRYPSAEELRADLRRFRDGEPVRAAARPAEHDAPMGTAIVPAATQAVSQYDDGTRAIAVDRRPVEYERPRRSGVFLVVLFLLLLVLAGLLFALARVLTDDPGGNDVAQVEVPPVIGQTAEEATTTLETAGFTVKRLDEKNEDAPVGEVFDQSPKGGENADKGSEVTIHVSQGAETKPMPNLVGQTEEEAKDLLQSQGFDLAKVVVEPQEDNEAPEGEVVDQLPAAGSDVALDAQITLFVSSGPGDVVIPDVSGQSVASASNTLGQLGFNVDTTEEPSNDVEAGKVIRTEPGSGTAAPHGSTVVLVVSSGPEETTVPDVVGFSEQAAVATLQAAGFQVIVEHVQVQDPFQNGIVQDQDPKGGKKAPAGSVVTIFVGQL